MRIAIKWKYLQTNLNDMKYNKPYILYTVLVMFSDPGPLKERVTETSDNYLILCDIRHVMSTIVTFVG